MSISGSLQTYWLHDQEFSTSTRGDDSDMRLATADDGDCTESTDDFDNLLENMSVRSTKTKRLVDWNVDVLHKLIRQIVARREASPALKKARDDSSWIEESYSYPKSPLEELQNVISFPSIDSTAILRQKHPNEIILDPGVIEQLRDFVTNVALL